LWGAAAVLAALYALAYIAVALMRMGHPFELEWMEGGVVDHVRRILSGEPLYVEPSLRFTPFIYPPLYFYAGAMVAKLLGPGFLPLRLLSFAASLVTMALIFATVRCGSKRRLPALLAACLFAASYREGGAWFDLARVDMLYICGMAAGIRLVRLRSAWLGGALGGAAFALAALTKQSALFIATPAAAYLLALDWRRGIAFAAALGLVVGGVSLWLDAVSGGWYRFYVFQLPRNHPIIPQLLHGFWTAELLGPFAIALSIGAFRFFAMRRETWRRDGLDLVLLASLILTAYATKIRVGSFDNLLMPAHLAASLALGWGLEVLLELRELLGERGRVLERFAAFLVLVQLAVLAYKPWRQLPPPSDLTAGRELVQSLGRVPGEVWIPSHSYLAELGGKPAWAHQLALTDVLRPGDTPEHRKLMAELRAAVRARRFGLILLDETGWLSDEVRPYYDHVAQMFGKDEKDRFWPMTGYRTRPDFVWVPKRDTTGAGR